MQYRTFQARAAQRAGEHVHRLADSAAGRATAAREAKRQATTALLLPALLLLGHGIGQAISCQLPAAPAAETSALAAALPEAAAPAQDGVMASKFTLAARFCSGMAPGLHDAPAPRSAQLDLYLHGSVSGTLFSGDAPAPAGQPAIPGIPAISAMPVPEIVQRSGGRGLHTQRIVGVAATLSEAARRHDIDPLLLHAIAHVESRHNTQAVSPAGARGLMQVMPATARRFGLKDPQRELLQAPLNVEASAAYLKTLQARFGNNLSLVLAAYNAGEGAVERYGRSVPPYAETRAYVQQVLGAYQGLRQLVAAP